MSLAVSTVCLVDHIAVIHIQAPVTNVNYIDYMAVINIQPLVTNVNYMYVYHIVMGTCLLVSLW